jgi:prepilin-type N-terminal cleavage/methylation domain-containing protein
MVRRPIRRFGPNSGFTLVEIIVVIVILVVLVVIAVPHYYQMVEESNLSEAQQWLNNLYQAQTLYYQHHSRFFLGQVSDNGAGNSPPFAIVLSPLNKFSTGGSIKQGLRAGSWSITLKRNPPCPTFAFQIAGNPISGCYTITFSQDSVP